MSNGPSFSLPDNWMLPVALLAGAGLLTIVAWRLIRRQARRHASVDRDQLAIQLSDFTTQPVRDAGPQLRVYNVPMRLALVVMAPAGRDGRLPDRTSWPNLIDRAIPQIHAVITAHQTEMRPWPKQLSTEGFCQKFFHALNLPAHGQGSPWSAVAGRVTADDQRYLIGLLLCSSQPNNLGQYTVERDTQWLDVLRIEGQENKWG